MLYYFYIVFNSSDRKHIITQGTYSRPLNTIDWSDLQRFLTASNIKSIGVFYKNEEGEEIIVKEVKRI